MNNLSEEIRYIMKSIDDAAGIPGYAVKNPRLIGQIFEGLRTNATFVCHEPAPFTITSSTGSPEK